MRVRMLSNIAGTPSYRDGQIVELEKRIAEAWLAENPPLCEIVTAEEVAAAATVGGRER